MHTLMITVYMHIHPLPTAVLFVFLFFFTTPPILIASINNIKFINLVENTTWKYVQVIALHSKQLVYYTYMYMFMYNT